MSEFAKRNEENYRPQYVTQAFKVIAGQAWQTEDAQQQQVPGPRSNGLEPEVDGITLVQLPVRRLQTTVSFYVETLGLPLEYPDRPIESNAFLQTMPRIGSGLHMLETSDAEFRHLHGTVNGKPEEYFAFYAKNVSRLHERLRQAGAEVVTEPSDGYMSFLDPEGHLVGVYERTDSAVNERFQSDITGFRHVQLHVADVAEAAAFFQNALGLETVGPDGTAVLMKVKDGEPNQPMIRLTQAADPANPQPVHWILDSLPKHALELHSRNIAALKERVLQYGGAVREPLDFNGCGGYLKFYTPDGHYFWVNQDRKYCDF